ncbi:MAG: zinc-dependent metalloprotease family protein [Polyangiales bacterium]
MSVEKFPYNGSGRGLALYTACLLAFLAAACSANEPLPPTSADILSAGSSAATATCPDPTQLACGGLCTDLRVDARNCGGCGQDCGVGGTCVAGACVCPSNLSACAGGCADLVNDRNHCGLCGKACGPTERCQLGQCVSPEAFCNPTCAPGQVCIAGVCQCPAGQAFCGGVCLDPMTTPQHCGACDNACAPAQLCQAGQCVCAPGQMLCGTACADVQTSSANCGACGAACGTGETCMAGKCRAPLGPDGCGGTARDIALSEVAAYQSIKVPLSEGVTPVAGEARDVDLIEGRKTLFRVSVKPGTGFMPRELSARVVVKNGAAMPDQYFAKQRVSGASTDDETSSTFQVEVPADKIKADTTYSVELVECSEAVSGMMLPSRLPATGEAPLDARKTGVLKIKIIPLEANSRTPDTSPAALKVYTDYLEAMYPIEKAELTVGEPLEVAYPVRWNSVIDQIRQLRQRERPEADIYYYGMLRPTETLREYCQRGCTAGVGYVGSVSQAQTRVSLGLAYADENSAGVMAHEIGHNHGRNHAPCAPGNQISGVDGEFPERTADTQVWGYDSREKTFFGPDSTKDIMGYCEPKWISAYTYQGLVERVARMNTQMISLSTYASVVVEPARERFQVMLLDAEGPRWSQPFAEPDEAFGEPEQAEVLDVDGQAIAKITVYRTLIGDQDGVTILVPPAQHGWNAVRTLDGVSLPFSAPVTVAAPK